MHMKTTFVLNLIRVQVKTNVVIGDYDMLFKYFDMPISSENFCVLDDGFSAIELAKSLQSTIDGRVSLGLFQISSYSGKMVFCFSI